MLDRNARKFPHKDCLRYGGRGLTFAGLKEQAERAAGLFQSWGVQKGDKIAIMSFNTPAFVIAFFGALKAGAAVVPVNHKLAAPEVDYILEHSDARALLFDGALSQIANNISVPIKMAAIDSDALVATPCRVRTSW
jgi:feruloyl-CoA synthase